MKDVVNDTQCIADQNMRDQLKSALLYGAKATGAFEIASRMTANRLRILCYHGTSFENEHEVFPGTFTITRFF